MLYAFFWVIMWHLNFICQCLRTLCLFHLHRQVGIKNAYLPPYEDGTECSETLTYKIQMSGNYPEESIQKMPVIINPCNTPKLLKYASQILTIIIQQ